MRNSDFSLDNLPVWENKSYDRNDAADFLKAYGALLFFVIRP